GRVDVARQDVEDRARGARISDLSEGVQDALFGGEVGVAQKELLDQQTGRLLGVRVAQGVDGLDADARVGVVGRLEQIVDRLRLVDLAERAYGFETRLGIVTVQLPDVLVQLLVGLWPVVAVPEAAFVYDLLVDTARARSSAYYQEICRVARRRGVTPDYVIDRAVVLLGAMAERRRMDLYRILGVAPLSTGDTIRQRWLAVARSTHPDVGGDGVRFRQAKQAYEILRD